MVAALLPLVFVGQFGGFAAMGAIEGRYNNALTRQRRLHLCCFCTLVPADTFRVNSSDFNLEDALQSHTSACGGPPDVKVIQAGEGGIFAARGTLRIAVPALKIFETVTNPDLNLRIFKDTELNYRKPLEDQNGSKLFEVSKTGTFRILGIPLSWESTVFALEDWHALEIRYALKRPGAMKRLTGFWRFIPIGDHETMVIFYNEAQPAFPLPSLFHRFAARAVETMARKLLGNLQEAATTWIPEV